MDNKQLIMAKQKTIHNLLVIASILTIFFLACLDNVPSQSETPGSNVNSISNQEEEITNSIGMKLRLIKAGSFIRGTDISEAWPDEKPAHRVTLTKDYYIGIYEVTQAEYKAVMVKNPSRVKGDNLPVNTVTWYDAVEFCKKLSEKTGDVYRLPTDAEWEYACRAGTTTKYYWGDNPEGGYAWHLENSGGNIHPVGQKKPNAWKLYDMVGNVEEWVQDLQGGHSSEPQINPTGPLPSKNKKEIFHMLRGMSAKDDLEFMRVTLRHFHSGGYPSRGFRIVKEVH